MKNLTDKFGSLGNWKKIDERLDETIVKQINDASCVSAVGEMLAEFYGLNISQQEILETIGEWSKAEYLAKFLNSKETRNDVEWIGGGYSDVLEHLLALMKDIKVWAAMLRDGNTRGHAVLVYGEDEENLILVKDPYDRTVYKIELFELKDILSEVVFRRRK